MKWTIVFLLTLLPGCSDLPPNPERIGVVLSLADVTCSETWIRLSVPLSSQGRTIDFVRDGVQIFRFQLFSADTLIYDRDLQPHHSYAYTAFLIADGRATEASPPITVVTQDTTSHAFTWQVTTLGEGSSQLRDVVILSENDVYAVGEVYVRDSSGALEVQPHNLSKWDGTSWQLQKIQVPLCGTSATFSDPLLAVYAVSPQDISFSGGAAMEHWDGAVYTWDCSMNGMINGSITAIWGQSSVDLYVVGAVGTILHRRGAVWEKTTSGTTVDLTDATGTPDGREVWCCGWQFDGTESILMRRGGSGWNILWKLSTHSPSDPMDGLLSSLCYVPSSQIVMTCGGRVFRRSLANPAWSATEPVDLVRFGRRIRASGANNIAVAGDGGMLWHWNGSTWHRFDELSNTNDIFYGLAASKSIIVAVGTRYDSTSKRALIAYGRM